MADVLHDMAKVATHGSLHVPKTHAGFLYQQELERQRTAMFSPSSGPYVGGAGNTEGTLSFIISGLVLWLAYHFGAHFRWYVWVGGFVVLYKVTYRYLDRHERLTDWLRRIVLYSLLAALFWGAYAVYQFLSVPHHHI